MQQSEDILTLVVVKTLGIASISWSWQFEAFNLDEARTPSPLKLQNFSEHFTEFTPFILIIFEQFHNKYHGLTHVCLRFIIPWPFAPHMFHFQVLLALFICFELLSLFSYRISVNNHILKIIFCTAFEYVLFVFFSFHASSLRGHPKTTCPVEA